MTVKLLFTKLNHCPHFRRTYHPSPQSQPQRSVTRTPLLTRVSADPVSGPEATGEVNEATEATEVRSSVVVPLSLVGRRS